VSSQALKFRVQCLGFGDQAVSCFSRAGAHDSAVSTAQHPLRCAEARAKSNSNFAICAKANHGDTSAHHLTAAEAFAHVLKQNTAQQLPRCKNHSAILINPQRAAVAVWEDSSPKTLPFYMTDW